jgi:hypothetical protein
LDQQRRDEDDQEHVGTTVFRPAHADPRLQQRTIFDEVVRPLAHESGTTAFFVVDAFRYEMGEEFFATLSDTPATTPMLWARLAELPTATEVGMNVLAPVADRGRLRPARSSSGSRRESTASPIRRVASGRCTIGSADRPAPCLPSRTS